MMIAGTRAGAMSHGTEDTVYLYGYGVYVGDEVPPEDVKFLGIQLDHPNPKIVLDSGKVVWGCECWWGSEEAVKKQIGDRKVIMVDIEKAREVGGDA